MLEEGPLVNPGFDFGKATMSEVAGIVAGCCRKGTRRHQANTFRLESEHNVGFPHAGKSHTCQPHASRELRRAR
jgi:hypothetical protein